MKLSERLEARLALRAGLPEWSNHEIFVDSRECRELLEESLALARRVEEAHERTVVQDREGFLYVGAMASGLDFGQRVALVPVEGGADVH